MSIPLYGRSWIMDHDESLSCLRETPGTYVDGLYVAGAPVLFALRANIQPLTGRDLTLVPEADRLHEQLWCWAQATPGMTMVVLNDFVLRGGMVYRTMSAEDWGSYTRARLQGVDTGPDMVAQFTPASPSS